MESRKISELSPEYLLDRDVRRAAKSFKISDNGRWVAAYFAARVVNAQPRLIGATRELAARMGVSPDTVENLARAYHMYQEFRRDARYKHFVRAIRKVPYIYYGHFRALAKAQESYHLSIEQLFSILKDVLMAEGDLSLRDLEQHIQDRFGDTRDWTYYGKRAYKEIHKVLQQPDLPKVIRKRIMSAYKVLGEKA